MNVITAHLPVRQRDAARGSQPQPKVPQKMQHQPDPNDYPAHSGATSICTRCEISCFQRGSLHASLHRYAYGLVYSVQALTHAHIPDSPGAEAVAARERVVGQARQPADDRHKERRRDHALYL